MQIPSMMFQTECNCTAYGCWGKVHLSWINLTLLRWVFQLLLIMQTEASSLLKTKIVLYLQADLPSPHTP
jgi:hypothetical protein